MQDAFDNPAKLLAQPREYTGSHILPVKWKIARPRDRKTLLLTS